MLTFSTMISKPYSCQNPSCLGNCIIYIFPNYSVLLQIIGFRYNWSFSLGVKEGKGLI